MSRLSLPIFSTLERAGVQVRASGKMLCPACEKKAITATNSGTFAQCWHCLKRWSANPDVAPPETDWASVLLTRIAEAAIGDLQCDHTALLYLQKRGLIKGTEADFMKFAAVTPEYTENIEWLAEQDLGVVTDFPLKMYVREAYKLLDEEEQRVRTHWNKQLVSAKLRGAKESRTVSIQMASALERLADDRQSLDKLDTTILPLLSQAKWESALVFVYRDEEVCVTSLNIRQYQQRLIEKGEDRAVMRIQPRANKRGLFGSIDASFGAGEDWVGRMPGLIAVEGEFNALSLKYVYRRFLNYFIPIVAMGGKHGADVNALKGLAKVKRVDMPTVVYDNDDINPRTGKPGGYDLVNAISKQMYCRAFTTPKTIDGALVESHATTVGNQLVQHYKLRELKDLDDCIKYHPKLSMDFILGILQDAPKVPLAMETIRKRIEAKINEPLKQNALEMAVSSIFVEDVRLRTDIYNCDGCAVVVLPENDDQSLVIEARMGDMRFVALLRDYGIVNEKLRKQCVDALNAHLLTARYPRTVVHSMSYWDGESLYINCFQGEIARLYAENGKPVIEFLPAGTDGILMRRYADYDEDNTAECIPWADTLPYLATPGTMRFNPNSPLDKTLFECVEYESDAGRHKQILKAWFLATFFSSAHESRLVLMCEGNPGAGKSSIGIAFGTLLIGKFHATNPPNTGGELAERMSGKPFVLFDDWDKAKPEVEAEFKLLTTGGKHQRRELYTTATQRSLSCDAAVMVTSNANPLGSSAGSSRRMLVVPIAPRPQRSKNEEVFESMGEVILPRLRKARPQLWVELIAALGSCVVALNDEKTADMKTANSMADFGRFFNRVAAHEGWLDHARAITSATTQSQDDHAADSQALVSTLIDYFRRFPENAGKTFTATEWVEQLQRWLPDSERALRDRMTAHYFGWAAKAHKFLLESRLGMTTVRSSSHREPTRYCFCPESQQEPAGLANVGEVDHHQHNDSPENIDIADEEEMLFSTTADNDLYSSPFGDSDRDASRRAEELEASTVGDRGLIPAFLYDEAA